MTSLYVLCSTKEIFLQEYLEYLVMVSIEPMTLLNMDIILNRVQRVKTDTIMKCMMMLN